VKTLSLFRKTVLEQLREPLMLGVTVTFGAVFMLIFGLAFGEGYFTYRVAVRNLDQPVGNLRAGEALLERLEAMSYDDGARMFALERIDDAAGLEARLQRRDLFAVVEIPATFSAAIAEGGPPSTLFVSGDPANAGFGLVRMMLQSGLDEFLGERGQAPPVASLATRFIETKVKGGGEFTYIAPGLMLMAIFLLLIQCSMVIVREVQSGTMLRLRLSRMQIWEFLLGVSASQVLFAALMLPLMYGVAVLVGFKGSGELGTAFVVGLSSSVTAVAFGLVNAAISRTVVQAFLWGNLITIPVVFLSGAFFPIPEHVLFSVFGQQVTLMDWLPSAPAVAAMNKVLIYGAGLSDVGPELFKMALMSALLFALGTALFSRTHLRRL
jgi:ABC-2 type transport system permease protein